jgi:hypothetical protein
MATLRVPGYSGQITTPHGSVEVVNGEATINIDRKAADADIKPLSADADDRARAAHARRVAEREDARRTVRMVEHFVARGYSVAGADTDPAPVVSRRRRDTASGQPAAETVGEEGGPSADELAAQVAARQEARGT